MKLLTESPPVNTGMKGDNMKKDLQCAITLMMISIVVLAIVFFLAGASVEDTIEQSVAGGIMAAVGCFVGRISKTTTK